MSDRDSFLKAIRANPDDDLPRLVFADWLDEHGDEKWAAVIRDQCARPHQRVEHTGHGPAGRRPTWVFQRGFVTEFAGPFAGWVAHADAVLPFSANLTVLLAAHPTAGELFMYAVDPEWPRQSFADPHEGWAAVRAAIVTALSKRWPGVTKWEVPPPPLLAQARTV